MDLLESLIDPEENLLPFDGVVNDYGCIYDETLASQIFDYLINRVPWEHDQFIKKFKDPIHGVVEKHIVTARQVAWFADQKSTYRYAGSTKKSNPWLPLLSDIKQTIEKVTDSHYNSCLINLYPTGAQGVSWHSDDESEIKSSSAIASLSLGATRKFSLKHKKSQRKLDLWLRPGQLIVMRGTTQTHWVHSIPKTSIVNKPRINLTFRHTIK